VVQGARKNRQEWGCLYPVPAVAVMGQLPGSGRWNPHLQGRYLDLHPTAVRYIEMRVPKRKDRSAGASPKKEWQGLLLPPCLPIPLPPLTLRRRILGRGKRGVRGTRQEVYLELPRHPSMQATILFFCQ
jgi:hypothetical protein